MLHTDAEISDRIAKIYREVAPGGKPPRADGTGELDSMAFIEFIALLEREFDISVVLRDLNDTNFKTLALTLAFVRDKLVAKGA
jgi:acyl carrier protein